VGRTTRAGVIALCVSLCVATALDVSGAPVAAQVQMPAQTALRAAAVLTVISGNVLMRNPGADFSTASDGSVLYVGSTIRTSADARAIITLFEGSTVELEPASDITIADATMRNGSTVVELAQSLGRSWHVVTHLTTADSRYEVKTPAATASVRGTAFEVVVDGYATTTVTTTEGRVATADAAATSEVLVTRDETTTVRANSAPEAPRSAPDAQRVVTVSVLSESSIVVDPLGRANGLRDGRIVAQTPGARVRMEDGMIIVTLPNVPDGVFGTTVAASAGVGAPVFTTVSDQGEEPVTVETSARAAGGSTTSGVELRRSGDKPSLRALTTDETKLLPDAKVSPNRSSQSKVTTPAANFRALPGASTTQTMLRVGASPGGSADATAQPAAAPRRTLPPIPSPTRP
jgi:hypothetical protein